VTIGGRGARTADDESLDSLDDGDAALDLDTVEGAENTATLMLNAEAQHVKAEADLAAVLSGQRSAHAKLGHMGEGAAPGQLFTPTQAPVTTTPAAPLSTYVSVLPALPEGVSESAVLRQIDDGLRMVTQGGRTAAEIRLEPAELGKMHVRLELEGTQARLYVTTEHAGVRDLVAQGLDQLRRDLLAQGLHSVHVEVRQQDQWSGQGRRDEHRPDEDGAVLLEDGVAEATPAQRSLSGRSGGARGRLDLTA
jgi:flagellar hook-length control protein FliK